MAAGIADERLHFAVGRELMMNQPKIIVIVVNYNNSQSTYHLCQSLENMIGYGTDYHMRCVIVDNSHGSEDSSNLKKLCSRWHWVTIINSADNPGYFAGLNRGLAKIVPDDRTWVVVGNNDLFFDKTFACNLIAMVYPQNVMAVCPDIVTMEGIHQNPHVLNRIGFVRRFLFDVYFKHYYLAVLLKWLRQLIPKRKHRTHTSMPCVLHMGNGACYILTPLFFKYNRYLDCPIFLYGEEAFLSDQIHETGGILWFEPTLRVFHAESASISQIPQRVAYEYARSGYKQYRKLM